MRTYVRRGARARARTGGGGGLNDDEGEKRTGRITLKVFQTLTWSGCGSRRGLATTGSPLPSPGHVPPI